MAAFKIQSHQANAVFTGWKGIGYYEFQFQRCSRVIAGFIRWLNTRDSEPVDMIGGSLGWEQLKMHKQRVSVQLRRLIMVIRQHLDEYEEAYDYFVDREDPLPLRLSGLRLLPLLGFRLLYQRTPSHCGGLQPSDG